MSNPLTHRSGLFVIALIALFSITNSATAGEAVAGNEFTITAIDATSESKSILIHFTPGTGIVFDRQKRNEFPIRFIPPVSLNWWDERVSVIKDDALLLVGDFKPGTNYLVSFPKEVENKSGRTYHAALNTFRMPDLKPVVEYGLTKTTIERDSRQMVHLDLTNVNEVLYEGVRISPILAADSQILAATRLAAVSLTDLAMELTQRAGVLQPVLDSTPELAVFGGGVKIDTHLFFAQSKPNDQIAYSIPLTFREGKEKGALQILQFKDNKSGSLAKTKPALYRITDLSLAAKVSEANLLVWATSLHTGVPAQGVSLLASDRRGNVFFLGKTGSDGSLFISEGTEFPSFCFPRENETPALARAIINLSSLRRLVAATAQDCNLLDLSNIRINVKQDSDSIPEDVCAFNPGLKAHLFTERGVYRPGETVRFKATLREFREGVIAVPGIDSCTFEILSRDDEVVHVTSAALSEFGTVHGEYTVPTHASVGYYTLRVKIPGQSLPVKHIAFQVQEFRPPRHHAEIRFRREKRTTGEYVNQTREEEILVATLAGRYYAGGPLKHGQVRWKIFSTTTAYSMDEYPHFTFGYGDNGSSLFNESGESILNESGEVEVRLPLSKEVLAGRHGLRFSATVIDFDGRTATQDENYSIRPDYVVGISTPPESVHKGHRVPFKVIVLDKDRKQVNDGMIDLQVMDQTGFYVRKRNDEGNPFWSWEEMWIKNWNDSGRIKDGSASMEVPFNDNGNFLVECIYTGADGNEYRSGTTCFANSYDQDWELGEEDRGPLMGDIQIQCDRAEYGVGDTVELRLLSPEPLTSCLLCVEREGVLEYHLVSVDQGVARIQVPASFLPNVYLTVLGVIGRGDFPVYQSQYDKEAPRFYCGKTSLKIKASHESLQVSIAPDQKDLKSLPGATMTLGLKATNSAGAGVEAELAVVVVDEQVLALTAYETPNLSDLLRYVFPDSVSTLEGRKDLLLQTPFEDILNEPLTGGGGEAGSRVGIQLREDFNPTAYFNPTVQTGPDGNATVVFDLPDTMTTYRVYVIACDKGERFASAERPLLVVKDFCLEPGIPRFLNKGDEISFSMAAFNKTGQENPISFQVQSDPEISISSPSQNYVGKPYDHVLLPVTAKALKGGEPKLTFTGTLGELSDAVRVPLPIHSGYARQSERVFKTLSTAGSLEYRFPFDTATIPVQELSNKDLSFVLTLSGSPFLKLSGGLRYLLQYPYGCAEQTSSGVLPLAALRTLIVDGLVPGITLEETDEYLKKGVSRLLSMQTSEGGFAYWPSSYQVSNWATLYASLALVTARDSGVPVDEEAIDHACGYITSHLLSSNRDNDMWRHTEGVAAYIVNKNKGLSAGSMKELLNKSGEYSRECRLLVLLAAGESKVIPREEVTKRLKEELGKPAGNEDHSPFNASSRESAVALLACAQLLEPTLEARGDQLAAELLEHGKGEGRWNSTSDTGWALLALGEHFKHTKFSEGKVNGHIEQPGLAPQPFSIEGIDSPALNLDPVKFLADPKVAVSLDSSAAIFAQLEVIYPRMDFSQAGGGEGFEIHKAIENTAGTPEIHIGDVVKVTITLTPVDKDPHYLVLDDPLPAGLVAINSSLASEEPVENLNEDDRFSYWESDGFYRLIPNHFEFRDDRVLVFRDDLWNQQFQYSYYARAVCAGSFRIPPTKVQLMYHPERCAYTPETRIEIKER